MLPPPLILVMGGCDGCVDGVGGGACDANVSEIVWPNDTLAIPFFSPSSHSTYYFPLMCHLFYFVCLKGLNIFILTCIALEIPKHNFRLFERMVLIANMWEDENYRQFKFKTDGILLLHIQHFTSELNLHFELHLENF